MNDAINALAPCPFCGGEACIERNGSMRQSNIVACENCGCRVESGDVFDPTASWNTRASTPKREAIAQSPMKLARDWKTVEEQIGTAQRDDLLALLRDYLVINSSPGNDLAPLYIARIDAILARLDEAAIREKAFEDAAMIARQVAINAERRSADHINLDAKQSALDKMAGAQEAEARIRQAASAIRGGKP